MVAKLCTGFCFTKVFLLKTDTRRNSFFFISLINLRLIIFVSLQKKCVIDKRHNFVE